MNAVDVAIRALEVIGTVSIASFDENSKEAALCKSNYDNARKAVLRMHPWKFAKKLVKLETPDPVGPAFEYTYRHALPVDFIRIISLDDEDFEIVGKFIHSDSITLELRYVYDITDVEDWDPLFFEAVAQYLAWCICYKLTSSETQKAAIFEDFTKVVRKARFGDSTQEPRKELDIDVWIRARNGIDSELRKPTG